MKVVFASTPEQRIKIMELTKQLYSEVFPNYFIDEEIEEFKKQNILRFTTNQFQQMDTLKDAYQVIASLQTLTLILEGEKLDDQYIETYYKNVSILEEYGVQFPFEYHKFIDSKNDQISIYTKVANDLLV